MTTEQIQFVAPQIRAKYWGQKVLVFIAKDYKDENRPFKCILKPKDIIAKKNEISYLQLRSIEALTGDEAITLASINRCFHSEYLTQIGIAIPHLIILPNGETFTASVEWLIENNIIKI